MNEKIRSIADVFCGKLHDIPSSFPKVVRVFLSSTFSDMHLERNCILQEIVPQCREYSREEYGVDFQLVDMRWGIPSDCTNNHTASELCLKELKTCQKLSLGPTFILIISHKYGTRILCPHIEEKTFIKLLEYISNDEDKELIKKWYQKDTNSKPSQYLLRPINEIIPEFVNKTNVVVRKQSYQEWFIQEDRMLTIFRKAATDCFDKGEIHEEQFRKFFSSITEDEVNEGLFKWENWEKSCIIIYRDILEEEIENEKMKKKFFEKEEESREKLNELKEKKIRSFVGDENIKRLKINFSDLINNGEVEARNGGQMNYLRKLKNYLKDKLKLQIDVAAKEHRMQNIIPQLQIALGLPESSALESYWKNEMIEIMDQANQFKEKTEHFQGRDEELNYIKKYILSNNPQLISEPLVVYGVSGCGKTSILGKAASNCALWFREHKTENFRIVLRFLGTTPTSSSLLGLLNSLVFQLSSTLSLRMPIIDLPYREFLIWFNEWLKAVCGNRPKFKIIIFLDSLDQLCDGFDMKWLPMNLPSNCRIIVSTIPDYKSILPNLRKYLTNDDNFLTVPNLEQETASKILKCWFDKVNRCLTNEQLDQVHQILGERPLALHLKLIFDITSKWQSYQSIDISSCNDTPASIVYVFKELENIYGKELVRKSIIYLNTSRNGMTESELVDILSLDDLVLQEVASFHMPPIKRVPSVLWSRIRYDLKEYLVDRDSDDVTVVYWYHRQFIEVSENEYFGELSESEQKEIFQNICDYYTGKWADGQKKELKYGEHLAEKLGTEGEVSDRLMPKQQLETVSLDGLTTIYNKRKLFELPRTLSKINVNFSIDLAINDTVFDYKFMRASFEYMEGNEIFEMIKNYSSMNSRDVMIKQKSQEFSFIQRIFLLSWIHLKKIPHDTGIYLKALCIQYYGIQPICTKLLKKINDYSSFHSGITVPYQQHRISNSAVIFQMDRHKKPIHKIMMGPKDKYCYSLADNILVLEMRTGFEIKELSLPTNYFFDFVVFGELTVAMSSDYIYSQTIEQVLLKEVEISSLRSTLDILPTTTFIQMISLSQTIAVRFHPSQSVIYFVHFDEEVHEFHMKTPGPVRQLFQLYDNFFCFQMANNTTMLVEVKSSKDISSQLLHIPGSIISVDSSFLKKQLLLSMNNGALVFVKIVDGKPQMAIPDIDHPELIPPLKHLQVGAGYIAGLSSTGDIFVLYRNECISHYSLHIIDGPFELIKCVKTNIFASKSDGIMKIYEFAILLNPFTNQNALAIALPKFHHYHSDRIVGIYTPQDTERMYLTASRDQTMKVMMNSEVEDDYNLEMPPQSENQIIGNDLQYNSRIPSNLVMFIDNKNKVKEFDVYRGEITCEINFDNRELSKIAIIRPGIVYVEIEEKIGCLIQKNSTKKHRTVGETIKCNIHLEPDKMNMDKIEIRLNLQSNSNERDVNENECFWKLIDFELLSENRFLIENKLSGKYFLFQQKSPTNWHLQEIVENFTQKISINITTDRKIITPLITEDHKALIILYDKLILNYSIASSKVRYSIKFSTKPIIQLEFLRNSYHILILNVKGAIDLLSDDGKVKPLEITDVDTKNIVRIGMCKCRNYISMLSTKSKIYYIYYENLEFKCIRQFTLQFHNISPTLDEIYLRKENSVMEQLQNYHYKFLFELSDDGNYLYTIVNNLYLFIVRLEAIPFPTVDEKVQIETEGKPINVVTAEQYTPRVIALTELFNEPVSAQLVNNRFMVVTCKNRSIYCYLRNDPQLKIDKEYQNELSLFHEKKTYKRIRQIQEATKSKYLQLMEGKLQRFEFYSSDEESKKTFDGLSKIRRVLDSLDAKFYSPVYQPPMETTNFFSFKKIILDCEHFVRILSKYNMVENLDEYVENLNSKLMETLSESKNKNEILSYDALLCNSVINMTYDTSYLNSTSTKNDDHTFNLKSLKQTILRKSLEFYEEKHNDIKYSDQNSKHFETYNLEIAANYTSRLTTFIQTVKERYQHEFQVAPSKEIVMEFSDSTTENFVKKYQKFKQQVSKIENSYNSFDTIRQHNPDISKACTFL
ncbi:hypothetical protein SNEBB_001197 [Seison nebaliae]|nr:hypothetical protein SNEBB_001197 [Seison nebaliae]